MEHLIPLDFSGVVQVVEKGEPILHRAWGFADLPNEIPNHIHTRFATASAGKAFVAAGIMKLMEQGHLSMDTSIGSILDFDLNQIDPGITVKELLNHTSGIPDYCDETVVDDYADLFRDFPNYKIRSSRDLLPLFIQKPMMYMRGHRFQYNNSGYVVLGLIIERISGQRFDEHLKQDIFEPLGMANTGYFELDRLPARCANAYILDEKTGEYYTNIYSVDAKGTGAGGAFTTAYDVQRFWQGLSKGHVISKASFDLMTTPQAGEGEYGYGFWLSNAGIPYFQGSDPGVSFISSYNIDKDQLITLISNLGQDVWQIHHHLRLALA